MTHAGLAELRTLVGAVRAAFAKASAPRLTAPARLYFVSHTSHLAEGWRDRVPEFELAGDAGSTALAEVVREACRSMGVGLVWQSPADVIPLPRGWEERSLDAKAFAEAPLEVRHFDPYSVVLRLVARGDEPDYVAALEYVLHGWVEPVRLEGLLGEVVPRMTSETLAQDPAEFRRKFKGLRQLYLRSHAVYSPGGTRVGEAVDHLPSL